MGGNGDFPGDLHASAEPNLFLFLNAAPIHHLFPLQSPFRSAAAVPSAAGRTAAGNSMDWGLSRHWRLCKSLLGEN